MTGEAGDRGRDGCCQTENGQFVEMSQIDVITDFFFYPSSGIFPFGSPKNKKQKTRNKKQRRFVHSFVLAWVLEGSGRRVLSMKCKIHTVLCYKQCEIKTELRKREKQKQNKKKKTMPGQKDSRVTPSGLLLLSTQRFLKLVSFSPPPHDVSVCIHL